MELGGMKTKRQAVNEALLEYVKRREQLKVLDLFGTVDFDRDYDYKAQRSKDKDFSHYQKLIPIELLAPPAVAISEATIRRSKFDVRGSMFRANLCKGPVEPW